MNYERRQPPLTDASPAEAGTPNPFIGRTPKFDPRELRVLLTTDDGLLTFIVPALMKNDCCSKYVVVVV